MVRLSNLERARALGVLQGGQTVAEVAIRFNVSRSTIKHLRHRFRNTGDVKDRPRSGRPRVTTVRQDRYIETRAARARFITANQIENDVRNAARPAARLISHQTKRNRLHAAGLRARKPAKRPKMTAAHRAARLRWAREHVRWNRQQWANVMFSDESRFCLRKVDGRLRVWRRPGERFADVCVQEVTAFGGGSGMIWAGITATQGTPAVIIQGI